MNRLVDKRAQTSGFESGLLQLSHIFIYLWANDCSDQIELKRFLKERLMGYRTVSMITWLQQ